MCIGVNGAAALSWDDLRLIRAIVEAGALQGAAARLGLDPSTAFRRLGRIERAVGHRLFERHRGAYAPLASARAIAALSARAEDERAALLLRVAADAPAIAGTVRVATSDLLLRDLLLPLLPVLRRDHPAITIDVVTGNTALNLARRDADIALRASNAPPDTLVGRRLARMGWAPHASDTVAALPGDAAEWVMLGDALPPRLRAGMASVPAARTAARFDTVGALADAVEAGLGIGYLPCLVGARRPTLRRLGPLEPAFATDLWLLTHAELRELPRIRAVLDGIADGVGRERAVLEGTADD